MSFQNCLVGVSMSELKTCPFCGGKARLNEYKDGEVWYEVWCDGCAIRTEQYETEDEAVKVWNRQAITLTKDEAYAVADFIDCALYDRIRNDTDIDCMQWLRNIVHAYEKLCRFSGFVGLTDEKVEDNEVDE